MFFQSFFSGGFGIISFIFTIFLFFIAILWALFPFAVFGTKHRLDRIIEELEKINLKFNNLEKEISLLNNNFESKYNKTEKPDKNVTNDNSRFMP